jgi:transcription antitermination factor NusG
MNMVMETDKRWLALYTRPNWEKKVADLLTRKSLENYCPVLKVPRAWADRKKIILKPLFTSYVFVRLAPGEQVRALQTDGVLSFVNWLGKPAVIRDEEIRAIQEFLAIHKQVRAERSELGVKDNIRIIHGPLKSLEGEIQEVRKITVKVYLPSLGYMLLAEVEKDNIEIIAAFKGKKAS